MTLDAFRTEYKKLFSAMMKYEPGQVGAAHYAEKMAQLADEYPDFAEIVEGEKE